MLQQNIFEFTEKQTNIYKGRFANIITNYNTCSHDEINKFKKFVYENSRIPLNSPISVKYLFYNWSQILYKHNNKTSCVYLNLKTNTTHESTYQIPYEFDKSENDNILFSSGTIMTHYINGNVVNYNLFEDDLMDNYYVTPGMELEWFTLHTHDFALNRLPCIPDKIYIYSENDLIIYNKITKDIQFTICKTSVEAGYPKGIVNCDYCNKKITSENGTMIEGMYLYHNDNIDICIDCHKQ